jgi:hypothetical protein
MNNTMKELKSALQQNDLNLAYKLAKKAQNQALNSRSCANCRLPTDHQDFRDHESYEESFISGLCMPCQDVFCGKSNFFEFDLPFKEVK